MSSEFVCPECQRKCGSAAGLSAHRRHSHGVSKVARDSRLEIADWSDTETTAVLENFVMQRTYDIFSEPSVLWNRAIAETLPKDRAAKRQLTQQLKQRLQDLFIATMDSSREVEVPVIIEKPAPPAPIDWDKELENIPFPKLAEIYGRKMAQVLEGLAHSHHSVRQYAAQPRMDGPKPRAVRVAMVSFLPRQEQALRAAYTGPLELRFVDSKSTTAIPCTMDWAIVQRHVGHNTWDKVRDRVGNARTFFNEGGIEGALRTLSEIELKQKELKV